MLKKKEIEKNKHAGCGHTCGECAKGEWNTDCFNYMGEPFQIYCEHSTYAYSPRRACGTCFDNTPACECFKAGERPIWRTKGENNETRGTGVGA